MNEDKKTIILGISGGIAAYKMADLASKLTKEKYDVHVIMTENATKFIAPLTFETLTGNKCIINTFDREFEWDVKHISLAKKASLLLIAPATANIIAKLAHGIADDMLSTTALAVTCPIIVSPSMNTAMYENKITQKNMQTLREYDMTIVEAESGVLACKDVGKGRLPKIEVLYAEIMQKIACEKDFCGAKMLITAGPTCEDIDPVRYITNRSSGKMGYELAKAAYLRGADVTLISGETALEAVYGVKTITVRSAEDMFIAVKENLCESQVLIKAAAVADFTPISVSDNKIKKASNNTAEIKLKNTEDILKYVGENRTSEQVICGFSMETENLVENSKRKLIAKNLDMIVANNLKVEGAGFKNDTNVVTIITKDKENAQNLMSKEKVAHLILDEINLLRK